MDYSRIEQQIKELEDEIFKTQKNKATEHHIGKLKAKIAYLKGELEKRRSSRQSGVGFTVKKSGDATVGIVGFPSVGKSTLLNQLTDASSRVGDYDFTTVKTIPGMMVYKGAEIQILDLPGIIEGASQGRGRGREILSAIRNVDLVMVMIDPYSIDRLRCIENELYNSGIRLNQHPPDVVIKKTTHGGLNITSTVPLSHLDEPMIKGIASQFVINADIIIREDITEDQLIDAFARNRVYVPALLVLNKIDLISSSEVERIKSDLKSKGWDNIIPISSKNLLGLDSLKEVIYTNLSFIRVYMKPSGKEPDYKEPMILREGATIRDVCCNLHRDMVRDFRYAVVWGPSAKHNGQKVGLEHRLMDTDIVTLILKKSKSK
ncbi:MAG: GTP-binding protein [Candidatus Thermoplasmatota archaeon]